MKFLSFGYILLLKDDENVLGLKVWGSIWIQFKYNLFATNLIYKTYRNTNSNECSSNLRPTIVGQALC